MAMYVPVRPAPSLKFKFRNSKGINPVLPQLRDKLTGNDY